MVIGVDNTACHLRKTVHCEGCLGQVNSQIDVTDTE